MPILEACGPADVPAARVAGGDGGGKKVTPHALGYPPATGHPERMGGPFFAARGLATGRRGTE